jgi:ribosomal RNA-processing protein 17
VEEHVQTVQKLLREAEAAGQDDHAEGGEEDEEWNGIPDTVPEEPPIDVEEEYVDEDRYTTVTIEAVSVDRDGLHKAKVESEDEEDDEDKPAENEVASQKTEESGKDKPKKKKKQKFRYETKFERRITERKQRAKKASRS